MISGNPLSSKNHFKLPTAFDLVFQSDQLGISPLVCIWALKCSPNYVPVGFTATQNCDEPKLGSAYCVLASLTEEILDWKDIFKKEFGNNVGFIKRAEPTSSGRNILAMGAFINFDINNSAKPSISTKGDVTPIYSIKRSESFFWTEKPVLKTQISDVTYDFNNMAKKADATEMNSAVLENFSHIPQTITRTISYNEETSSTFSFGTELEVGLTVEVGIGIPIPIIKSEINIDVAVTVTKTNAFEVGKDDVESTTKSIIASMEIPDGHRMTVVVVANKYTTTIPYSATLTKYFYDGSIGKKKISGEFKGVNIDEVKVEYSGYEPLINPNQVKSDRERRDTDSC